MTNKISSTRPTIVPSTSTSAAAPEAATSPAKSPTPVKHGFSKFEDTIKKDFDKMKNSVVVTAAEAVGIAELAGFRYPVESYSSKVSDTLTRGSRLDHASDYTALKTQGFKSIVDLTMEGTQDEKLAGPAGLNTVNIKILDNAAPTESQMKQFLDFATKPENQPCYVHCEAGKGRTGVAVACYRMAVDGWTLDQALTEGKAVGLSLPNQLAFLEKFDSDLSAGHIAGYRR